MVFSLRQLQEKCREQQMPLYVTFIIERASSESCPRLAAHPSCRAWLSPSTATCRGPCSWTAAPRSLLTSEAGSNRVVSSASYLRDLLRLAFEEARRKRIYLRTRSDGRLFNLARLRAKTKVCEHAVCWRCGSSNPHPARTSVPDGPRWHCTMVVSSAHCYTVARHGPRTPGKKGVWTPSTWEASAVSWEYRGKTRCSTLRSCLAQVCPAYSHCSDRADSVG